MVVKLDTDIIRAIALFEKVTRVYARDCIIADNCVYFIVDPDKVGLAIGKGGSTIKDIARMFGKPIKIFGYSDDPIEQIKNLIPNIKSIQQNNESIIVTIPKKDKMSVIGRNGSNINIIKQILKRHFAINDLKIR